jgi:glycosyltransferase involved in cell wall biosynthesis
VQPNPSDITRSVLELIESPRRQEELSVAAQQRAREHYNWSEVCRRYESSLAELADAAAECE